MDTIKKVISVILSVSIICSMIPLVNGTVYGAETEQLSYAGNGSETEKILPQEKDGTTYLFLPAEADYEALKLAVAEGVTLQGTVEGERLDSSDINGKAVDLTVLFGTMEPGKAYPLSVYNGEALEKTITLMKSANLPSMHITLDTKDLSYIHQNKENKDTGQMVYKTGDDEITVPLARLKGRGNSSWQYSKEKRPYNIKLDSKKELIAGAGKAKDWCLLSNNVNGKDFDRTGLCNYLAYNLFDAIGGDAALKSQSIDLYINHEYRGTYFLTEKVEIKDTRVDITETEYEVEDETYKTLVTKGEIQNIQSVAYKNSIKTSGAGLTWKKAPQNDPALNAGVQAYQYATGSKVDVPGGFLLEIDTTFSLEASWFITRRGTSIVVKEPEFVSKGQLQQIAIYVQEFEDALYAESGFNEKGMYYTDYIDLDSFVKRFAVDCVLCNGDMMDKSCFFHIDVDEDGGFGEHVLMSGPAWDYDMSDLGSSKFTVYPEDLYGESANAGRKNWISAMIKRGDLMETFTRLSAGPLRQEWERMAADLGDVIAERSASQTMNEILWANGFSSKAVTLKNNFSVNRFQHWYNTFFDETKNLLGVTVSYEPDTRTLKADVTGTAQQIQWYQIGAGGKIKNIENANSETYTVPENATTSKYGVAVTGASFAKGCYTGSDTITLYSDYSEIGKNIFFIANGELVDGGEFLVQPGDSLDKSLWPSVPPRTGYSITGWSVDQLSDITEDTVVEAVYEPHTYQVVYDRNGADGGRMDSSLFSYDGKATLRKNTLSRTGYRFKGWNTAADGSGKDYEDEAKVVNLTAEKDGTVKLYAQWELIDYSIMYDGLCGADNQGNPNGYSVESGPIVLKNLNRRGYSFLGWTWENQKTPVKDVIIPKGYAGTLVFTANWEICKYSITYVDVEGAVNANPAYYTIENGVTLVQPLRKNFEFLGWTWEGQKEPVKFVTIGKNNEGDRTFTAHWRAEKYTITYQNGVTGVDFYTIQDVTDGGLKLDVPQARTGYTFAGWSMSVNNAVSIIPAETAEIPQGTLGDITLTGIWLADNQTLTLDAGEGTFADGKHVQTVTTEYEGAFSMAADPVRTGYDFAGWFEDEACTVPFEAETMPLTMTIYAKWTPVVYTITYGGVAGAVNSNPATYTIESAAITLTAPAKAGYVFTGWTYAGQTTPVMTVVIPKGSVGNKAYTANFMMIPTAPAKVTTALYGYDDIKVTWSAATGATSYQVYMKKGSGAYKLATTTSSLSYKAKNLADGAKYTFKVVAYNGTLAGGEKASSAIYTLKKVTGVKVVKSGSKVKVSWKNIQGETGYQISKMTKKKGTQKKPTTYKTTKGKYKKLAAAKGKTYYYKVRAYKTVNGKKIYGPWSAVKKFKRK